VGSWPACPGGVSWANWPPGADIEEATHRLVALIDGLSVEAVLYPARVPPGRQGALLDQLLRDFAGPPLHPARTLTE
jgi:hypothetical protein